MEERERKREQQTHPCGSGRAVHTGKEERECKRENGRERMRERMEERAADTPLRQRACSTHRKGRERMEEREWKRENGRKNGRECIRHTPAAAGVQYTRSEFGLGNL